MIRTTIFLVKIAQDTFLTNLKMPNFANFLQKATDYPM